MALRAERSEVRERPRQEWRLSYLRKSLIKIALLGLGNADGLFYRQNSFL